MVLLRRQRTLPQGFVSTLTADNKKPQRSEPSGVELLSIIISFSEVETVAPGKI
jgi:hypothetical protein